MDHVELSFAGLHKIFTVPEQWRKPFEPGIPNAFSKHFAYLPDVGKLMFHNVPIGEFDADGFTVDHMFAQEVRDTFRRRGLQLAIKER